MAKKRSHATTTVWRFDESQLQAAADALAAAGISEAATAERIIEQSWRDAVRAKCDADSLQQLPTESTLAVEALKIAERADQLRAALEATTFVTGAADYRIRRLLKVPQAVGDLSLLALYGIANGARDTAADLDKGHLRTIRQHPQQARREAVKKIVLRFREAGGKVSEYVPGTDAQTFGHRGQSLKPKVPSPFARFVRVVFSVVEGRPLPLGTLRECLAGILKEMKSEIPATRLQ